MGLADELKGIALITGLVGSGYLGLIEGTEYFSQIYVKNLTVTFFQDKEQREAKQTESSIRIMQEAHKYPTYCPPGSAADTFPSSCYSTGDGIDYGGLFPIK